MQWEWVVFASLIVMSSAKVTSRRTKRAIGDEMCKMITLGGVKCVTRTQFVLGFQDPDLDEPSTCPPGSVCADVEDICSTIEDPACSNDVTGVHGVCNACPSEVEYNPVCVTETEYAFCRDEVIATNMKYRCPVAKPYCKAEFNQNYSLKSICTAEVNATDCAPRTEPDPLEAAPPAVCTADGWFADTSDKTCQAYFRCYGGSSGFMKIDFKCMSMNSVYHPELKRCVSDGSYVCPP